MKIVAVETHLIRVPCDIGAAPTGLRRRRLDQLDTLLRARGHRRRPGGLGRGLRPRLLPGDARRRSTRNWRRRCSGEDARDIRGLMARMAQRLHLFGRNGPHVYALSALDIALWDIAGKAAGLPLWRLLGGAPVGTLPAYASLLRYSEPALVAQACERALDAGLPRDQAARNRRAAGGGGARGRWARTRRSCSTRTAPGPWTRRSRMARRLQPLRSCAGWKSRLAAGGPCRPGARAARGRRADRRGRERGRACTISAASSTPAPLDIAQPSVAKIGGITEVAEDRRARPRRAASGWCRIAPISGRAAWPRCTSPRRSRRRRRSNGCSSIWRPAPTTTCSTRGRARAIPDGPGLGRDPDPDILRRYALSAPTVIRA